MLLQSHTHSHGDTYTCIRTSVFTDYELCSIYTGREKRCAGKVLKTATYNN